MVNMSIAARGSVAVLSSLAAVVFAACAPADAPQGQQSQSATKDVTGVGTVLVDQSGRTLYFTDSDEGGIRCTGECLSIWLPATGLVQGAKIDGLGTVKRPDNGTEQLTYQGKPLYAFTMDNEQRPAAGHNVKDSFGGAEFAWHAAVTQGAPQSTPTGGGGGYGGGGY